MHKKAPDIFFKKKKKGRGKLSLSVKIIPHPTLESLESILGYGRWLQFPASHIVEI